MVNHDRFDGFSWLKQQTRIGIWTKIIGIEATNTGRYNKKNGNITATAPIYMIHNNMAIGTYRDRDITKYNQ